MKNVVVLTDAGSIGQAIARRVKAPFGNAPMKISARLSEKGDTILVDSKVNFGNRNFFTSEKWTLQDNGKTLAITQTSNSFRGKKNNNCHFRQRVNNEFPGRYKHSIRNR